MLRELIASSVLEIVAIASLAAQGGTMIWVALALHLIASSLFSYGIGKCIRHHWSTWIFAFALSFFLPVLAPLGLSYALYLGEKKLQLNDEKEDLSPFKQIKEGQSVTLNVATDSNQNDLDMMESLLATNRMTDQDAIPLLQKQLYHEAEDVRLLAVSLLEQRENALREQINKLEIVIDTEEQHNMLRYRLQLARLYLSMAELGLAKDEMALQVLREARDHTLAVVEENEDNRAKAHYLLGQIYMQMNELEKAEPMFSLAMKQGLPKRLVVPRLAEIAYRLRRFSQLRFYLRQLDPQQKAQSQYAQLIKAWS